MKTIFLVLIPLVLFGSAKYAGSTTASVTLVAGIIKAQHIDNHDKKYKRKDCPVCEGKGWYISGDQIQKVDCGYCEPDSKTGPTNKIIIQQHGKPYVR